MLAFIDIGTKSGCNIGIDYKNIKTYTSAKVSMIVLEQKKMTQLILIKIA